VHVRYLFSLLDSRPFVGKVDLLSLEDLKMKRGDLLEKRKRK
jgi:hypothetical protein